MFRFITKRPLWVNIVAGMILAFGLLVFCIFSLGWFTNHDDAKTVPAVLGKSYAEAITILTKAGFTLEVQDSVYVDSLPPLQVLKQIPDEHEVVKSNRTIYITINRAVPPTVEMPNLVGYSLRNAILILANTGLKLGDTTFRIDFAKNSILEQLYNGVTIQPGAKIRMGSAISLIVGNGLGNTYMAIPNLIGKSYAEAKILLDSLNVSFGSVIPNADVVDNTNGYIYRQSPERFDEDGNLRSMRAGQTLDIWLSATKPEIIIKDKEPTQQGKDSANDTKN